MTSLLHWCSLVVNAPVLHLFKHIGAFVMAYNSYKVVCKYLEGLIIYICNHFIMWMSSLLHTISWMHEYTKMLFYLMWIFIYNIRPLYGVDIWTVDSIYGVICLMGRETVYPWFLDDIYI